MELKCKNCDNPRLKTRKICAECNRERVKKYHNKDKRNLRVSKECLICKEFKPFYRESQSFCGDCYDKSLQTGYSNDYVTKEKTSKHYHRALAEKLIGRSLSYYEVVHHVDEDILNNSPENLWVLSRSNHIKLHIHLRKCKMFWESNLNNIPWNEVRVLKNYEYISDNNIEVIKLKDLII